MKDDVLGELDRRSSRASTIPVPATPPAPGSADLREKMDQLVACVPRHAIRLVIDEIDGLGDRESPRARLLREALVEQFNSLRPMKARRLFTGLFEPFLVDDPVLYRSPEAVPGLLQRVDMGGIWQSLSRFGFPLLAIDVQERLDLLSQDELLDQVLLGDEAMGMRDRMRREAVKVLVDLERNRSLREEFLALANREALKDARSRSVQLSSKAVIDTSLLGFVRALLEDSAALLPMGERMRRDLVEIGPPETRRQSETDAQMARLGDFMREQRRACPARDPVEAAAWLPPLFALNTKKRVDLATRFLMEWGGTSNTTGHPLQLAITDHFLASCNTITDICQVMFSELRVLEGHTLALPEPLCKLLEQSIQRFEQSLDCLCRSDLIARKEIGYRARPQLLEVTQALNNLVLPITEERVRAALSARHGPVPDQSEILWLMRLIWRWGTALKMAGFANQDMVRLRSRLLEEGHLAFLQATRMDDPDEPPIPRMDHMVRINSLLATIGEGVAGWVSPVSHGLRQVVEHYLDEMEDIPPDASAIIESYVASVRLELKRSRHWQSPELIGVINRYDARGARG